MAAPRTRVLKPEGVYSLVLVAGQRHPKVFVRAEEQSGWGSGQSSSRMET